MKHAAIGALSLTLLALTVTQAGAQVIDSYTTPQSLMTATGKSVTAVVDAPEALGGKRRSTLFLTEAGPLALSIGGGALGYKLAGGGLQSARIGWLWYVDPSLPSKPVDLTAGGKYNAFLIEVLEMSGPIVVQVDALDADNRFDSVMVLLTAKPGQPLVYDFASFISPSSPAKIDFTRLIGLQVEIDLHTNKAGTLKLGPLRTIKK